MNLDSGPHSLPNNDQRVIAQVIHNILLATFQVKLYDMETPAFMQSIDSVAGFINFLGQKHEKITISEKNGMITINGDFAELVKEESIWGKNFIQLMKTNDISYIDLATVVTFEELIILIRGITKKKGAKDIIDELEQSGSTHVYINKPAPKNTESKSDATPVIPKPEEPAPPPKAAAKVEERVIEEPPRQKEPTAPPAPVKKPATAAVVDNIIRGAADLKLFLETGNEQGINTLLESYYSNLATRDSAARIESVVFLSAAHDILLDLGKRNHARSVAEKLAKTSSAGLDAGAFRDMSYCLKNEANRDILEGDLSSAVFMFGAYKAHAFEAKKDVRLMLQDVITEENLALLINDIASENRDKRDGVLELLIKLKEAIVPQLIKAAANTEDPRKRRLLLVMMRSLGDKAAAELLRFLNTELSVLEVSRLIEVIDSFSAYKPLFEKLTGLLSHADFRIRKEIVGVMTRLRSEEAKALIVMALGDQNLTTKMQAVKAAGELSIQGAVPLLHEMIKPVQLLEQDEENSVQVEACTSLSKIQHNTSVAALKLAVFPPVWMKQKSDRVRAAAVQAIGQFAAEEANKILLLANKDGNPVVRKAAEEALKKTGL